MRDLEGGAGSPAINPVYDLFLTCAEILSAYIEPADLKAALRRALITSEQLPDMIFTVEAGGIPAFLTAEEPGVAEEGVEEGGGGAAAGGGGGAAGADGPGSAAAGGGGGGGDGEPSSADVVAALVSAVGAAGASQVTWRLPEHSDLTSFTPAELDRFFFGYGEVKYMERFGDQMATTIAGQLHKLHCALRDAVPIAFPRDGPPEYKPGDVLSNCSLDSVCLPLANPKLFCELAARHLPLGRALVMHGMIGPLQPARQTGRWAGQPLDFREVHAGLTPDQCAFSIFAMKQIVDILGAGGVATFEAIPDMRKSWKAQGTLHKNTTAGARLMAAMLLITLHSWGVHHALVACAPLRILLLHVCLCMGEKVTLSKATVTREDDRTSAGPKTFEHWTIYVVLFGVSLTH